MKILYTFLVIPVFFSLLIVSSCRKDFSLDEINKLKTDSLHFEGSVAIPLVNTELTLENFIPANDSTLWVEVDENELVHLRMYIDDLIIMQMNQIFTTVPYPAVTGFPIPADTAAMQSDTSRMKVYSKMLSGKLFFKSPTITFKIENAIPVVTFFKMDTLTFHDANSQAISHTGHTDYVIGAPTVQGNSVHTDIVIDTLEMPVLSQVFSPVPKFISFYLSMGNHNIQNLPFDVTGNEQMVVDVDIDLPLHARLDTIVMSDTSDFNLSVGTYEQIKSATLKIKLMNGFPIDAFSQIYFADTTATGEIGEFIDSVFTDLDDPYIYEEGWRMESAETNSSGIVTLPHESTVEVFLDQDRITNLRERNASKIIIMGKLNTWLSQTGFFIKILGSYKMGIKIAVKADFETSTN
jgi:hypothetical protein